MTLIDAILTLPGTTTEKECQRRIAAINAVIAICDAEEGAPSRPPASQKRLAPEAFDIPPSATLSERQKRSPSDEIDDPFHQAIASGCAKTPKERPTICFLCLGNPRRPGKERLEVYKNSGSLSRHFVSTHIKSFPKDMYCECSIC